MGVERNKLYYSKTASHAADKVRIAVAQCSIVRGLLSCSRSALSIARPPNVRSSGQQASSGKIDRTDDNANTFAGQLRSPLSRPEMDFSPRPVKNPVNRIAYGEVQACQTTPSRMGDAGGGGRAYRVTVQSKKARVG